MQWQAASDKIFDMMGALSSSRDDGGINLKQFELTAYIRVGGSVLYTNRTFFGFGLQNAITTMTMPLLGRLYLY